MSFDIPQILKNILLFLGNRKKAIGAWWLAIFLDIASQLWGRSSLSFAILMFVNIAIIWLFISTARLFIIKQKKNGLNALGALFLGLLFYTITSFAIDNVVGDGWANHLKIPTGIQLGIPAPLNQTGGRLESVLKIKKTEMDFQLYGYFGQPGTYQYDFWASNLDSGTIYLKAYEITKGDSLSTYELPKSTLVQVLPTDSITRFGTRSTFTIYEGDWGNPYAATFEVWLKPGNGGKERKLFAKNYKIEGWQR